MLHPLILAGFLRGVPSTQVVSSHTRIEHGVHNFARPREECVRVRGCAYHLSDTRQVHDIIEAVPTERRLVRRLVLRTCFHQHPRPS